MSALLTTKQDSYRAQRAASAGAGITLVVGCSEYIATFDCAKRCAQILGNRELREAGDGIFESIPVFKIPLEEINIALGKLAARFSVALVDLVCNKSSSRFVLVWKIMPAAKTEVSLNVEDY